MRFKVAKPDLEAALQAVGSSLSNNGTDITTHFVFRLTDPPEGSKAHGVEVLTNAGRVFSSCPVRPVEVQDSGEGSRRAFTVEGKRLKQWLDSLKIAALVFTLDETETGFEVVAQAPRAKQTFQSLDPTSFPFWDQMLAEAEVTATLEADRLASALAYSKLFTSDRESSQPHLCVCEVKDGILYSTDKKAVTLVKVDPLEKSKMRVHHKDATGFLSFLATCDGKPVEVLEHDRSLIFRRVDGAVFGESRFQAPFPTLKIGMDDEDHHRWVLPTDEVVSGVKFLVAGAPWEDNRLCFRQRGGTIVLSMASVTGKMTEYPIEATETWSGDAVPDLPEDGFALDHFCLSKVLGTWRQDSLTLGLSVKGDRGWCRVEDEKNDDRYLTIMAWLR